MVSGRGKRSDGDGDAVARQAKDRGDASPVLVWFRQDLRLSDNPALDAAVASGRPVIPVFILDDAAPGKWRPGGASRWWLHHSLAELDRALRDRGSRLILRAGASGDVLQELVAETGAAALVWNRLYDPWATARDRAIKSRFRDAGLQVDSHVGNLAFEPWTIATGDGNPYKVFSAFQRACLASGPPQQPLSASGPDGLRPPDHWPGSAALDDWNLTPTAPDWAGGLRATWTPGEAGARARLTAFIDDSLAAYRDDRDRMDRAATSCLSPHLHFGEISVARIWSVLDHVTDSRPGLDASAAKFRSELIWREFSHHLLFHFPDLPDRNWKREFDGYPWVGDEDGFRAWCRGQTGYPLVDAGMRELWHTGYMHNRVRMVAASFLVKHLRVHWLRGAEWFWDTLVDADLANNSASWQWVAGCGADAAPYFRIFNPARQAEKFDPAGKYLQRWVPEASGGNLCNQGLGYQAPIVDHALARQKALDGFEFVKRR